ncbi:MAG TPA: glycosyltransferase [Chitinophaga sp.]|uniref:glycosyltransferase n=1 Tax=Chitinophaga sp. TaxID=1869181 RepID=UPI002DB69E9D|nr:glycosyltransferase [Chitinophaga sp.]HEU4552115.1 glycosyltransferase [Chitinophaga sp.]
MQIAKYAPAPTGLELWTLRVMIFIGTAAMGYFLYCLLAPQQVGYAPFYWLLIGATIFNCLRVLHEWYHYLFITVPPTPPLERHFTVDILTTFCAGEPYSMIIETLKAIQRIHYPHTTYLCDEENDPFLKSECERLGVRHVTRTNKKDAKAGNINNALQQATGELCVVLDPDHVPLPNFLDPVIPHFNNDKVGFVQVVQAYDNLGESLIAKGAAQQTFQFYGPMMMTMNHYGTVLAIGANCTFRRAALDSIGGHAAGLSEDMHTAMQLHAKGWKSVYVPAVLTYGLAPSTLSAYYRQQLKWARGTFELLVTTFPALFKKFTWRQRLHYGTIPFHYFSGVIFLINFLVPILSLTLGLIPIRMDLVSFALIGMPFISATLAIRHFVQRWVMGEDERGNHVVGGLLLIGTWWIYILGLFYTIIRKKVPYIPTPKDDSEPDNWRLNIPNGIIAVASVAAVFYGLHVDWNPYAWVMAGIAGINCCIMLLNIAISRQKDLKRIRERFTLIKRMFAYWLVFKQQMWFFRHGLYTGIRRFALLLMLGICFTVVYLLGGASWGPLPPAGPATGQPVFYSGIFSPGTTNGLTEMRRVSSYQQAYHTHFGIVALYIPWGDEERCYLPQALVDTIYRNGSYPLITWEPWTHLFRQAANNKALGMEKKVCSYIVKGAFDAYLEKFAAQLRALHRPVYLRFAHEPDNPFYPWSYSGGNTPQEYISAWQYVHDFLARRHVQHVIWVWNPWKATAVNDYFPGTAYVDWLGVTCLNYGPYNSNGKWYGFKALYAPFHNQPVFRAGLPVMVAEAGSLQTAANQQQWLSGMFDDIDSSFREIKAVVLFNSAVDKNVPAAGGHDVLNWQLGAPGSYFTALARYQSVAGNREEKPAGPVAALPETENLATAKRRLADTVRGINYQKGQEWYGNFYALTRREVARDFSTMRQLGINTIKRAGPGVYDRNILAVAEQYNMRIYYSFWMPAVHDMLDDRHKLDEAAKRVLATVKKLKDNKRIVAWNFNDTLWQALGEHFYKPALLYQQQAYITWLKKLAGRIRAIDPVRPVTMDIGVNERLAVNVQLLQQQLPEIDAFGLILHTDTAGVSQISGLRAPCFISQVPVARYVQLTGLHKGAFITRWQDAGERDYLTFDGLLDHWGRYKPSYYQLAEKWSRYTYEKTVFPELHILRPAKLTKKDEQLTYRAIVNNGHGWTLQVQPSLHYEWHLVKTDAWGNAVYMKKLGQGPEVTVRIPEEAARYSLYLTASNGKDVIDARSPLNIPL